jgi:hypothetical protein
LFIQKIRRLGRTSVDQHLNKDICKV